jgi:hypothetical protein
MAPTTNVSEALEFVVVVGALQLSYLIWGVMQESIMHTGTCYMTTASFEHAILFCMQCNM